MSSILAKQIANLKKDVPANMSVFVNEEDFTKLGVVFYFEKSDHSDEHPKFFPSNKTGSMLIKGTVHLKDFPTNPPKLVLDGEMAHSHVYPNGDGQFKICFSLDESFQWYFSGKNMQSSKFNPSVTLRYYLISVYKFLADDDLEHPIQEVSKNHCLDYWTKFKFTKEEHPEIKLPYYECLSVFDKSEDSKSGLYETISELNKTYNFDLDSYPGIVFMTDFVDKDNILLKHEVPVYGINFTKKGERYIFEVSGFDFMKHSTFTSGVRKTSVGNTFNNPFPVVVHSKIWDLLKPYPILDKLVSDTLGRVRKNQIIKLPDKVEKFDNYLYIISELFNELAINVFAGNMYPCEEVLKGFVYLHHLLLVLERDYKEIRQRTETILDYFEKDPKNRDKKICPNVGILMTQYLMSDKQRDNVKLVKEMFARNCLWSLMKPSECKNFVEWNKDKSKFVITDIEGWINVTWKNSYIGMQRFAFQQLYNNEFSKVSLDEMDTRFGTVEDKEISLFQNKVKELNNWGKLKGRKGYQAFFEYFNLDGMNKDLENEIYEALERSTQLKYHDFVIKRNWSNYIK